MGKKTGRNPTDRGKIGSKKSILNDGRGIPLAIAVHPSSQHDSKTIDEVLDGLCIKKLKKGSILYCDKGYDDWTIRIGFHLLGVKAIIPKRGKFKKTGKPISLGKFRWVVERTHSWINDFRKLKTRWEKKSKNFIGLIQIACSIITFREVLG